MSASLMEVGASHRFADPEPLRKMLKACEIAKPTRRPVPDLTLDVASQSDGERKKEPTTTAQWHRKHGSSDGNRSTLGEFTTASSNMAACCKSWSSARLPYCCSPGRTKGYVSVDGAHNREYRFRTKRIDYTESE